MAVVAVIGGAEGWEESTDLSEGRREWFAKALDMPTGAPRAYLSRAIWPEAFAACRRSCIDCFAESLASQVVAFDGEVLRGAIVRWPSG